LTRDPGVDSALFVLPPLLPRLRCPLHGIWGAHDVLFRHRLSMIGPALARAPRFESLVLLPQAGHWVQFEAADDFNAALAEALSPSGQRA
jgi:pimeloyl-ACP methyl ester carboxylesterase